MIQEFCVFVASARPRQQTAETLKRLYASLTRPSDFFVGYGNEGKTRTQNRAILTLAKGYKYWAAVDDDILLPLGWQDCVAQAFEDVPLLGAAGVEYLDTAEHRAYMMEVPEPEQFRGTTIRLLKRQNLTGACIVTPCAVLLKTEPVPVLEGVTYEFYDDGWRCQQIQKLGLRCGYVRCAQGACTLSYPDTEAYTSKKISDIARAREIGIPGLV